MNLDEYFSHLQLNESVIIISAHDEASKYWKNFKMREQLNLKAELSFRASYIAVIDLANNFIYENTGFEQLKFDFMLDDGNVIHVTSCGYKIEPNKSSIMFDGNDYSQSKRGINLAIYNKKERRIVDSFYVDSFVDSRLNVVSKYQEYYDRIDKIKRGFLIADKYCSYDISTFYIIINHHLGDSRGALRLFKPIKEYYAETALPKHTKYLRDTKVLSWDKTKKIKKLVAVTTESIFNFAKLFEGVDDIIVLSKPELNLLESYVASSACIHQNIICDVGARKWVQKNYTDEGPWCRSDMYGITETMWDMVLPLDSYKYSGSMVLNDERCDAAKKILFDCLGENVSLENVVILCPIAQSSSMLEISIWEKFVQSLVQLGYKVLTNLYGDETKIKGSYPFKVGVDTILCLVHMGCNIVGVQSGLMDIVAMLNSPKTMVLHIIKTPRDVSYASKCSETVTILNNIKHLRIEHFEEDYVLKLLIDSFC